MLEAALLHVDEHHNVIGFDDVLAQMHKCHEFCRAEGIEPVDLDY